MFFWGYCCSRHLEESERMGLRRTPSKQSLRLCAFPSCQPSSFLVDEKIRPIPFQTSIVLLIMRIDIKISVFLWARISPLMGIVRLEPLLMSNLVKRSERWYLKPREVKGTSGLTQPQDPGIRAPVLHCPQPSHGLAGRACRGWFLAEGLFEQFGAEEWLGCSLLREAGDNT